MSASFAALVPGGKKDGPGHRPSQPGRAAPRMRIGRRQEGGVWRQVKSTRRSDHAFLRRFNGVAGDGGRIPAGAGGDADLHHSLRPHHRRRAGVPQPLPALLQSAPRVPEVTGLEACHQLPLLRAPGIQLLLQHALRVSLLPSAGGGFLPRPHGRLRLHVSLRGCPYDPAGAPGQPLLPGPGPHSYAGIRMEPPQPPGEGQLLRPPHLPGTIPALGAHGLLNAAGQLNPRGPPGDCCGPHLLLPGGCLPQPAWWQEAAADPWLPVSAEMTALPTHPQMVPYPMGEPLLAEAQCGPLPTGSCYWMPQRRTPITCPSSRSSQDPRSSDPTQGQGQPQGPIFPASGRPAFPPQPRLVAQLPVLEAGPCPGPTRINNDLHPLQTALALLPQPAIPFHAG
ncbi:derlin-3 isoform X2 [Kogia breviceps]|uniref:derlin-3 isoform X2 n=1 Tax=Kogia breviceps TaxID=27615 RepID=UPI0034D2913C